MPEKPLLNPEQSQVLIQDFSRFTEHAIKVHHQLSKNQKEIEFYQGKTTLYGYRDLVLYENPRVAWYGGLDRSEKAPIATPEDYIEIRDNYDNLKQYISTQLDIGRIDVSTGGHGGAPGETNPADNILFLHTASSNEQFKRNLRMVVVELLDTELDREFKPADYMSASREEELRETLLEYSSAEEAGGYMVREYSTQFNKLDGLLHVTSVIGTSDNEFRDMYDKLKDKATQGYLKDEPDLMLGIHVVNIHNNLLRSIASIQKGTELRDFWLQNIGSDTNPERVYTSISGFMGMYHNQTEIRREIPSILSAVQQERQDSIMTQASPDALPGFYFDKTWMDRMLKMLTKVAYGPNTFYHVNENTKSLDVLYKKKVFLGGYLFDFDRYTASHVEVSSQISYDLDTDEFTGNHSLEPSVRAFIDRKGLQLPDDIWVNSLAGRKIGSIGDSQIIKADPDELKNKYEGIVLLNGTQIAFLYDSSTTNLMLGPNIKSSSVHSMVGDTWVNRRPKLVVENKIPLSNFSDNFDVVAQKIDSASKALRGRNNTDSLLILEGRISEKNTKPYLTRIIHARLAVHGLDLE